MTNFYGYNLGQLPGKDLPNAKIIAQQAELSNNRQTQDILNSLGRFVAWAGSGSQAATVNG